MQWAELMSRPFLSIVPASAVLNPFGVSYRIIQKEACLLLLANFNCVSYCRLK